MANATAITVNALTANSHATVGVDQFDVGTAPVTVLAALTSHSDRCILEVTNLATVNLTVSVLGDAKAAAYKGTIAALSKTGISSAAPVVLGPFSRSRYSNDGALSVTLTPVTTAAISAEVHCYLLPASVPR